MLLVWWSHIACISVSNATGDLQASSTYFRPYFYYNRRPSYPTNNNGNNRRPVYPINYRPNYGNNWHPNYYPALPATTRRPTYYPAAPTTRRPTKTMEQLLEEKRDAYIAGHFCNSAEAAFSSQGPPEICWDSANKKLRTSSNLTIESFVTFYARLYRFYSMDKDIRFRDEICEQSRRFNNVGIICVPFKDIDYDEESDYSSDVECPANARKTRTSACITDGNCICFLDQYHKIAKEGTKQYWNLMNEYHAHILLQFQV